MHYGLVLVAILLGLTLGTAAESAEDYTVRLSQFADQKAVFATVESPNVVPARARIGGSVASLAVRQGDVVTQGQVVAVIADPKLLLQIGALDAQITGLAAQLAQAQSDLTRAETLFHQGAGPRVALDQARTAQDVASSALRARTAERAAAQQNLQEGQVLAPVAGRVMAVPITVGSVVLNGDPVATIAELPFKLRLRIPEQYAVTLKQGDPIHMDARQLGAANGAAGTISLIYPRIEDGRVIADASVTELGEYFAGNRVRIWIEAGTRNGFEIPEAYIRTRAGLDYVMLRQKDGHVTEVPVQRGRPGPGGVIEILSGIAANDVLAHP